MQKNRGIACVSAIEQLLTLGISSNSSGGLFPGIMQGTFQIDRKDSDTAAAIDLETYSGNKFGIVAGEEGTGFGHI